MVRKSGIFNLSIDDEKKERALESIFSDEGNDWWYGRCKIPEFTNPLLEHEVITRFSDLLGEGIERSHRIVPLGLMLSELSQEEVGAKIRRFRSASAISFEPTLRSDALRCYWNGSYVTYLLSSESDDIIGYMMLGLAHIDVPKGNGLSKRTLDALNLDKGYGVVPAYRLAQLSYSFDAPPGTGGILHMLAHDILLSTRDRVGGNLVLLDCDDSQARQFERSGFSVIDREDECINHMIALL